MTKVPRVAVAGAGYIGLAHIDAAQRTEGLTLSAVVDPSLHAKEVAQKAGVPWYGSLEDLLEQDRPEGVVLATPNAFHVPHTVMCLDAGVACLLEKPIAPTVSQAQFLVQRIESDRSKVLIGHHRAHSPIMQKAVSIVQGGGLGKLVAVMGSATFFKPPQYYTDAPWRTQMGAGPILLNLIHDVHNLRMLCGDIVAVQAFASNAVRGYEVEDTVSINLRFKNGVLGTFLLSDAAASAKSWEHTSQENKAYPSCEDEDCYVLSGTMGSLSIPTMRMKSYPSEQERSWWKPFAVESLGVQREDPIARQMVHFRDMISLDQAPLVSARDGLLNLLVTEAITLAATKSQMVEIDFENQTLKF